MENTKIAMTGNDIWCDRRLFPNLIYSPMFQYSMNTRVYPCPTEAFSNDLLYILFPVQRQYFDHRYLLSNDAYNLNANKEKLFILIIMLIISLCCNSHSSHLFPYHIQQHHHPTGLSAIHLESFLN